MNRPAPAPALAIDASEWFVDEAWRRHVSTRHWRRLPARAAVSVRLALTHLQERSVRATFFVSAPLAYRERELLMEVIQGGHEVALSVRLPWPLDEVPESERPVFVRAWQEERAIVEQAIGAGVHGFCSAWHVAQGDAWWHEELQRLGFDYDATPVRGSQSVAVVLAGEFAGALVAGERFMAWHLDEEQPRLVGLPRAIREAHDECVRGGVETLLAACQVADGSIARSLELRPRRLSARVAVPLSVGDESPAEGQAADEVHAPRLAIIVPLKDEADSVPALFVELSAVAHALADVVDCEFVVVDDGSTDQTWMLLERTARSYPRVRLVRHDHNRGVAAAIRTGMHATDAEWIASIDGDLSYDPMELRKMVPLMADAEVVTASPYHPDGGVQNVPDWRLFLSRTLSRAYRLLLRSPIQTWTSCFRVYRREFVADLPLSNQGFLGTAELLVRVLRRGGRVVEHPCVLEARLLGFSKMRILPVVLDHMRLLVLVALRRIK